MKMRTTVLLSCLMLTLVGCAGSNSDDKNAPATMPVDLERYQGTWYELARLPMFFQRNCVQSQAQYTLRDDGRIDVVNSCQEKDGKTNQVQGIAEPQVPGKTDKLWVQFDNWFSRLLPGLTKGEYWVLYHDQDYRVALVGHPNREYLWLLSRSTVVTDEVREQLLDTARKQGYDTSKLVWREAE